MNSTLTTGIDAGAAFTGTADNDTFVANSATLTPGDSLDGGAGDGDTLSYSSNGGANEAGFKATSVENLEVTADRGALLIDVTGMPDLIKVSNLNSSSNVTLNGGSKVAALELKNVTNGNTTLVYDAPAVAGTTDKQTVLLENVNSLTNTPVSQIAANGIEIFDVTTGGTEGSLLTDLVSNAAQTLNVMGTQDLKITGELDGFTKVDATSFTGKLDVFLDNQNLMVIGGSKDDIFRTQAGDVFNNKDSFDGKGGTDTLFVDDAVAIAGASGATFTSIEQLGINNGLNTGTVDMDKWAGVNKVISTAGGVDGNASIVNVQDGFILDLGDGLGGNNLTVDHKTDTAADDFTLNVNLTNNGPQGLGTVTLPDAETFNLNVTDTDGTTSTFTIGNLQAPDLNGATLNITGNGHVTVGSTAGTGNLSKIDASTATGNINVNGLGQQGTGLTITTNTGNDTVQGSTKADTINTGAGNDLINASAGSDKITTGDGKDVIDYDLVGESQGLSVDTITDFSQGNDVLNLFTVAPGISFLGNAATFANAVTSLTGKAGEAVFVQDDKQLLIDVNGDGVIDGVADMVISLPTVTTLTAADLGLQGVTFTANTTPFQTNDATDSVEGTVTGPGGDTINATVAQINNAGTIINGLGANDTLNISGAGTANLELAAGQFLNTEIVTLSKDTTGVDIASADIAGLTTLTGDAGKNQTLQTDGADLTGVNTTNIENLLFDAAGQLIVDEGNFASFSTSIVGSAGGDTLRLNGNTATPNFDFSTRIFANVETIDFDNANNVTFGPGQLATVTSFTDATGGGTAANIFVNNGVNFDGFTTITDGAVGQLNFNGQNVTIDNDGGANDGIVAFEQFIGNAGSTLILADDAGANFVNGQINGVGTLNANALATNQNLAIGTGANGLTILAGGIGAGNDMNLTTNSNVTVNGNGSNATSAFDFAGTGDITVSDFDGNDIDNTGSGTLTVNQVNAAAVDIQAAGTAANTIIDVAPQADNETLTVSGTGNATVNNVSDSDVIAVGGGNITIGNASAAAGVTQNITTGAGTDQVTYSGVSATATLVIDLGAGNDQINTAAGTAGATIGIDAGAGADQYTLGAGTETLDINATDSLITGFDVVNGFMAGTDRIDSVTGNAGNQFNQLVIATADTGTLAAAVNTAVAADVAGTAANYNANGDAYLIQVQAGSAAGTYLVVNEGATNGAFTAAEDVFIQLQGINGVFSGADII